MGLKLRKEARFFKSMGQGLRGGSGDDGSGGL